MIEIAVNISRFVKEFKIADPTSKTVDFPDYQEISNEYKGTYHFEILSVNEPRNYKNDVETPFENALTPSDSLSHRLLMESEECLTSATPLTWQASDGTSEVIKMDRALGRRGLVDLKAGDDAYALLSRKALLRTYNEVISSIAKEVADSLEKQGFPFDGVLEQALVDPKNRICSYFINNINCELYFKMKNGNLCVTLPEVTFKAFIKLKLASNRSNPEFSNQEWKTPSSGDVNSTAPDSSVAQSPQAVTIPSYNMNDMKTVIEAGSQVQ